MVKNTHGGNKSKGMARKNLTSGNERRKLRLASCDLEKYAVVTRLLGNGMFYTTTNEGNELLGRIRNKFKGRNRRGNDLTAGVLVLVGLREWEAPNFKECDLLEVYDANEIKQIKQITSIDIRSLYVHMEAFGGKDGAPCDSGDCEIEFTNDAGTDYFADILPDEKPGSTKEIEEEIDFDEI
jgi:translation initiation factor IF-1